MDLRPIEPEDLEVITEFFLRVPERDRTFFNEDVLDPAVVEGFLHPREGDLRLNLHDDDGSVVGWLALFGGVSWSHHVARIGLVVDPAPRGRGLGKQLAREGLCAACRPAEPGSSSRSSPRSGPRSGCRRRWASRSRRC